MVKDVSGKIGDFVCSTTMELVSRNPRKCKVCKDGVKTKKRIREHIIKDHRVRNFVVLMKDVTTSPLVISPIPLQRVFPNNQGSKGHI